MLLEQKRQSDLTFSSLFYVSSGPEFYTSGSLFASMSEDVRSFAVPFERGAGLSGICPLTNGKRLGSGKLYLRRKGVCNDSNGQPPFFQLNFINDENEKCWNEKNYV